MMAAAFTKGEREFLNSNRGFVDKLKQTKTAEDYARLCEAAEELLKAEHRANPAAQQFRQGSKQRKQFPPPSQAITARPGHEWRCA
jgi:hypothetical protein